MKIDLVRQTPVPPPIDHAVITVNERELRVLAAAVMRDSYSGIRDNSRTPTDFTSSEWDHLRGKFTEIYP